MWAGDMLKRNDFSPKNITPVLLEIVHLSVAAATEISFPGKSKTNCLLLLDMFFSKFCNLKTNCDTSSHE